MKQQGFLPILEATDAEAVRTVVAVHARVAAVEVQVAAVAAIHRTGPVVAVAACVVDCTIVVIAVPRHTKQTDKHFTPSKSIISEASVLKQEFTSPFCPNLKFRRFVRINMTLS